MLSERQEALLASIINSYVETAEPVSSKLLEQTGFFGLKSATIRLAMNALEERGYLWQLHTSGGRVPTDKAYRYFVDHLISLEPADLPSAEKSRIRLSVRRQQNPHVLTRTIAQLLADLTGNVVITNIAEEIFYKTGLTGLLAVPDFSQVERLFQFTSLFDQFETVFNAFFSPSEETGQDLKIFIGRENPVSKAQNETVMTAKYQLPENLTGSLTLIGPMRMNYRKNIGRIKFIKNELNKISKSI